MLRDSVKQMNFGCQGKAIRAAFDGGAMTSDGGVLLIGAFEQARGLTESINQLLCDPRNPEGVDHQQIALLRQRIYQIIAGYEDCNDAERLRHDPALRALVKGADTVLASQPTLCRLENRVRRREVVQLNTLYVEWFIEHFRRAVYYHGEILLDIDSTDDPTHGNQEGTPYNAFYGQHMYHPLLIFEGHTQHLLAARLRHGQVNSAHRVLQVLRPLVRALQQAFPRIPIRVRADAGFATPKLYTFCEAEDLEYAIGLGANAVLKRQVAPLEAAVQQTYLSDPEQGTQRRDLEFEYQADSWEHTRRVCAKVEYGAKGENTRFIVTTAPKKKKTTAVIDWYDDRGEAENRMEEVKGGFFCDRLSCKKYVANAFRLHLHAFAYNIYNLFRRQMRLPELRRAKIETMRNKVVKVAARVVFQAGRIWFHLASSWPYQELFVRVVGYLRLKPATGT